MNAVQSVLATLLTLGAIGVAAPPASQPSPTPSVPPMSPEQREAVRQAFDLPPGSEFEVEISNRDGGTVRTVNEGRGVGAGAVAEGDKLSDAFTGSPPMVGLGADGSQTAQGGGADRNVRATAVRIPPLPWQNPMFWLGLLSLAGCGACIYMKLRRAALVTGLAGVGLLVAAFFPVVLLFVAAGAFAVVAGPYLYAEWKKAKAEADADAKNEALRAVVAGVEHRDVPVDAQRAVKAAVAKEADASDKDVIDAVKRADRVGKYAD